MNAKFLLACAVLVGAAPLGAAPLTQGTFTEVVNDVKVVAMPSREARPAKVQDLAKAPELVRTGRESRAELVAPDQTLTRIGANTAFSFEGNGRDMRLDQGSVLFYAPKGKGGGRIKTGGATAAISGSTMIVATTTDSGFKAILLEGRGRVTLASGRSRTLREGEMVVVTPDGNDFGPNTVLHLSKLLGGSLLVNGFAKPLASQALIQKVIDKQEQMIAKGRARNAGEVAATSGVGEVDPITRSTAFPRQPETRQQQPPGQPSPSPSPNQSVGSVPGQTFNPGSISHANPPPPAGNVIP